MNNNNITSKQDFVSMFEEYYPKVYNYLFIRLLNKETTEDLSSEVFIKVFNNRSKYDPERSKLTTWIFVILENTLIDFYRKNDKNICNIDISVLEYEIIQCFSTEDYVISKIEKEYLLTCLFKLHKKPYTVIYMRYFLGYSYKEIALKMNISEKNVSVILSRSIKKLKLIYEDNI